MQRITLSDGYDISRVIRGGWQLSESHSNSVGSDPVSDMIAFADAGITTFDCADIYTGVEELIGRFRGEYRNQRGADALKKIRVHTKFVPDMARLSTISKDYVQGVIDTSLRRLRMEQLDTVQFHWWDYRVERWLESALWLEDLHKAGKINRVGGTNFDTAHALAIRKAGVPLSSMQMQYSLLDRRPEKTFIDLAKQENIAVFCYGTVAGGFFGERWLGAAEPKAPLENRSLVKYKLIIEEFGGWALFQELLAALFSLARKHGTGIATIASAAVLARPGISAVIVGARNREHLADNLKIADVTLDADDHRSINTVLAKAKPLPGDIYELERDISGPHGSIMKYDLNSQPKEVKPFATPST
jgi:aryl-alcohol dehydrogenase-like predicted oxidoreductase